MLLFKLMGFIIKVLSVVVSINSLIVTLPSIVTDRMISRVAYNVCIWLQLIAVEVYRCANSWFAPYISSAVHLKIIA